MELPPNSDKIVADFKDLDDKRKQQIVAHLAQVPGSASASTINQLIANGGHEARLVGQLFNRTVPGHAEAPQNKRVDFAAQK